MFVYKSRLVLSMKRLQRLLQAQGGQGLGGAQPGIDKPMVDTSEMVYISSLALLKMLKHGKEVSNRLYH